MKNKSSGTIFLFILIICSINFFEFQAIRGSIVKYFQFGYLFLGVLISLPHMFPKKNDGFILPVQLISFSIILSIFISMVTWGQSFGDSLAGSILVLVWVIFFYLKHVNFSIRKIEKIIIIYGIIYLFLYFFQFLHSDKNYFIDLESVDQSRGITRIVFPGQGVFYVTVYMAINKLTTQKRNKWFWATLSIMGIVVTVMQVTRQYIFAVVIIYLYHFVKDQNLFKKIGFVSCVLGLVFYIIQSDNPIVEGLRDTQQQTAEDGADYIRVRAATFFLTDFSHSPINRILGNGEPYGESSPYYKYTTYYITNYGYWLADVGLVAVYAMFGVFAVLGYILIWVKSYVIKLPKNFLYLRYYLWYLLLTSLTSATSYLSSNLIATVLVVYIYQHIYEKEKINSLIHTKYKLNL
ncbi:hypothetical protein [Spirosoma endophyticum]|uniref:O-antigen ligase like membrane protein n=1 Tax=Spirosoma endophyticum TaxID=662367 RepID=A0A1I2FRC3_9BACT|nr:hypothetical protein [Spirosoma endophyticum]SFF07855.1 hypothetical protein SAMN05216167_12741 [Spirosoma endophyticum]